MKIGNTEKVIRTSYLLELGKDFQESDLEILASNGTNTLKSLSKDFRTNQFPELNIGSWVFCGHYDEKTQTVLIKAEKEMFI